MQVISEVGPCVGRDVSFSRNFEKVHVLEGSDYQVGAELLPGTVDLLREVLVYDERKKAGEEVGGDAVVASEEDGTCLELGFGESEAVFDYPAFPTEEPVLSLEFNLVRSYSSFDSIGPFLVLKSTGFHPVVWVDQSCRLPSSFLSNWTVMKERSLTLSCFLL